MKVYEVRIDTTSLVSGLIIIKARDERHAKELAMTNHRATGVVSVTEVDNDKEPS